MDGEERTYGGCEGPDAMYVKLISSDGHEFIVKREHALTSGTIKAMLSGPAPQKSQNSPSLRRLHWNCSWLPTFWIAKVTETMFQLKKKRFRYVFVSLKIFKLFCQLLYCNPISMLSCYHFIFFALGILS
uniref:SKP1 component POZ domain-containing protein n=1 Tax=Gasterosteus aculeatus aculeatus TaxID=481459 RepID=A0AAQ4Q0X8_GASAC